MLRSRGIPVTGVVLNGGQPSPSADPAEATNPDALARILPDVNIISVPRHAGRDVIEAAVPYLSALVLGPPGLHS